jgi:type II secretory pathway pseudopilin PulG
MRKHKAVGSFSLVEVVAAIGLVSFAVLATFGLLSVANDTSKNARDEGLATRLVANELARIRSLSSTNFPHTYVTRYFDRRLVDLGTDQTTALQNGAMYQFSILNDSATSQFPTAPSGTGDWLVNAEVRFPVAAPAANQTVFRFTTVLNDP